MDVTDMDFDIHCLERDAYFSVLKAFNAQSDGLSWGREGLLSDLRVELRVSNDEHRETLGKIGNDEFIKTVREWRQELQPNTINGPGSFSTSAGHASCKKLKSEHHTSSLSPKFLPHAQPSPMAVPSSFTTLDQRGGDTDILSRRNVGQPRMSVSQNMQAPSTMKGRRSLMVPSFKKGFVYSGVDCLKSGSDTIEILATDELIHEVERICGGEAPDPAQVKRAKLILWEHERALTQAITKLANMSDGGNSPGQRRQGFHNTGYNSRGYSKGTGTPRIDIQDEE